MLFSRIKSNALFVEVWRKLLYKRQQFCWFFYVLPQFLVRMTCFLGHDMLVAKPSKILDFSTLRHQFLSTWKALVWNSSNVYSWKRLSLKAKQGKFSPTRFFYAILYDIAFSRIFKNCNKGKRLFWLENCVWPNLVISFEQFYCCKVAELFQFLFLASGVQ